MCQMCSFELKCKCIRYDNARNQRINLIELENSLGQWQFGGSHVILLDP